MVVPHANSPRARLRYPGRPSQPYLDGGMPVQTDDLNRASHGVRRVHEHHRPRPVTRPGKGKNRSDPAAVYEGQLAEIDMDWVVPVKVRECERELRRREEVKLTRQAQTDERVDGRNLKNSRRQLRYPCFDSVRSKHDQQCTIKISCMSSPESNRWHFLTNHSQVLLCIEHSPDSRLRDIAEMVGVTERAAQRIVRDLVDAGYVRRERVGRRNRYVVNSHAPMRHPAQSEFEVGALLRLLRPERE
jgi:hypothetical protein